MEESKILVSDSLQETLWRLEEVRQGFRTKTAANVQEALEWVLSRQGLEGSYCNLFLPTSHDLNQGVTLPMGERVKTDGGTRHVLGEEALRTLIDRLVHSKDVREELTDVIVKYLPSRGIVYKGMPADRDLMIMADATFIYRKYKSKQKVYVASIDYHFIPNRVQVGSYLSGYKKYLENELDSVVRDKLAMQFGFIGDEPLKVLEVAKQEISSEKT